MTTGILFPSDSLNDLVCDSEFSGERETARWADIGSSLVNHDRLTGAEPVAVFRRLPAEGKVFYRGWMMPVESYELMADALATRGLDVVTSPVQYATAHHLPGWVNAFKGLTPETVVLDVDASREKILEAGRSLGSRSFVVKDYVKSRKSEWDTACFASSLERLPEVTAEFIRLQDEWLVGGIVIREFVNLNKDEPEVRIWWVDGRPVLVTAHPDDAGREIPVVPDSLLDDIAVRLESLDVVFVTTDIALKEDGSWVVIEVGDGQVSGLPSGISDEDMTKLFEALAAI